jgi:hypothetical protein
VLVVFCGNGAGPGGLRLIPSRSFAPEGGCDGGLGASVFLRKPNLPVEAGGPVCATGAGAATACTGTVVVTGVGFAGPPPRRSSPRRSPTGPGFGAGAAISIGFHPA